MRGVVWCAVDILSKFYSKKKIHNKPFVCFSTFPFSVVVNSNNHFSNERKQKLYRFFRWDWIYLFLFAEILPLQTILKWRNIFISSVDSVLNYTPVCNAQNYLRWDEFSSKCSFSLWRCRARLHDARVRVRAPVCESVFECLPHLPIFTIGLFRIRWECK